MKKLKKFIHLNNNLFTEKSIVSKGRAITYVNLEKTGFETVCASLLSGIVYSNAFTVKKRNECKQMAGKIYFEVSFISKQNLPEFKILLTKKMKITIGIGKIQGKYWFRSFTSKTQRLIPFNFFSSLNFNFVQKFKLNIRQPSWLCTQKPNVIRRKIRI